MPEGLGPVDIRNRYKNSVSFDSPVRTNILADKVVHETAAYSAGSQSRPEKYFINIVDNLGVGNKVLQIRDKNRQNDPGENDLEIDFGSMSETHIRTKDNVVAILALKDMQKELVVEETADLKNLLNQAEAALVANLTEEDAVKLKTALDIEIADNSQVDSVDQDANDPNHIEDPANIEPSQENESSHVNPFKKLKVAFVSALDRHTSKVEYQENGKTVTKNIKSKDVITKAAEQYSAMKMSETKERREGNWFKKIADRMWRGTLTEQVHKVKEKFHGLKLMEAAKVDTGITAEFDTEVDKLARGRIKEEYDKKNWFQKGIYNVNQATREIFAVERDLHKKKVEITAELRAQYEANPADSKNPLFDLVHRDVVSREALADGVMNSDLDFLHAGDKKSESIKIKRDSAMDKFLKNEILLKIKDDIVTQSEKGKYTGKINPELRMKLDKTLQDFCFTDEFRTWLSSLDPEVQKKFENSFTYANNLLSEAETSFVPLVHECHDQLKTTTILDMDIEIMLGTAKFGPNGEVDSPSIFDKERVSLNQKLFDRVRESAVAGNNKTDVLFSPGEFPQGLKWETTMARMNSVAYSEFAAAYVGAATTRVIMSGARASVSWLPILGGSLMAGGVSGFKEFRKLKEMRKQFSREKALGDEHPGGANAVRSEAMRRFAYNTVDLGHRNQQLEGVTQKLVAGDASEDNILLTFAYLADTKARRTLGDRYDDNLFDADKSTPEGRANYHAQEGIMDKTASLGLTRLSSLLDGDVNSARRTQIANRMGMDPAKATNARSIMYELAGSQTEHLRSGIAVPDAYKAVMGMGKDLIIDERQSMTVKDQAFNKWIWGQSLLAAGRTAALATVIQVGAGQFQELQVTAGQTVEHLQTTLLDHDLPTHVTGLPDNGGQFFDPTTNELLDMHYSHIPTGTHWVVDSTNPHAYDLVLDSDAKHEILSDATFAKDGTLISNINITNQINANHVNIDYTQHTVDIAGSSSETVTTTTDAVDLHAWELPGYKEEGFWGWYKNTLSQDGHKPSDAEINSVLKTARGINIWHNHSNNVVLDPNNEYASVQVVHSRDLDDELFGEGTVDLMAAPQGSSAIFKDVPSTWGTPEGHQQIAKIFLEAKAQVDAGVPFGEDLEGEVHRIVYEAGIDGEHGIPDELEANTLLQYFTTSTTTPAQEYVLNDIHITLDEDIIKVEDITHDVAVSGNPFKYMVPGYFRPLEAVNRFESNAIPYELAYYGNGGLNEDRKKLFRQIRSPRLLENSNAILDDQQEINDYLNKLDPQYRNEVTELESQLGAPSQSTKLTMLIPVADHQEGNNIGDALENYAQQTANPSDYEIILFLNHPETDKLGNPISADNTEQEIRRIMTKYPNLPIKIMKKTLPVSKAKISLIRKYLSDVALQRHSKRYLSANAGQNIESMIMVSNDADNKGVAPKYVENYLERFAADSEADAMLGQLDWDPEVYAKYPIIHAGTRLFQYLGARGRRNSGRMPSSGANFAYKSSIYAAIGGYLPDLQGGEDIALGQAITEGRGKSNAIKYAGAVNSRVYTSARRAVDALGHGLAPIEQWNRGFSAFDDEVRRFKLGTEKEIDYDDPTQLAELKTGLEAIINRTIDTYEAGEKLGKNAGFYRQALSHMGIEYFVKNGDIMITDMDVHVRGLKHFKEVGTLMQQLKSHQGTEQELALIKQKISILDQQYAESIKATDINVETERKAKSVEIDQKLEDFNNTEKLELINVPPLKYTLDELKGSAQTEDRGDYVLCLDKPLGSGQMGVVVAGYNKQTGQMLSFKRVKKSEQANIAKLNRYPSGVTDIEELVKTASSNENLGTYLDKLDDGDNVLKVNSLESTDLDSYMEKVKILPPKQALSLMIKLMSGVRELHKGNIVHLDISPTNILVGQDHIKLIDFDAGSIKQSSDSRYVRGFVGGFKNILPPELFLEKAPITASADTYEASILLYKLVTGDYPYHAEPGLVNPGRRDNVYEKHVEGNFAMPENVPEEIKEILKKGIKGIPKERYQTADDMLGDLLEAYKKLP